MEGVLTTVLPVFLIILAGYAAAAGGLLGDHVADGLSDFVFVVAIPVLLFRTLATAPLPEAQPWFYWLAYFAGLGLGWLLMSLAASRLFGMGPRETAIMGFCAAQANTVFVGIPLILRAFGEAGAVPMFLLLAVHLPLTMTVATLLVERGDAGPDRWRRMASSLARHPILIGIALGAAWRGAGAPLPEAANAAMRFMGDAAGPTALFALGMTLKRYGLAADPRMLATISLLKLVVHPAAVYLLAVHVLPMPPVWSAVAVMFAACPSGVNGYLLAKRYDEGVANASAAIAATTTLAVVSTSFWVWLVSAAR